MINGGPDRMAEKLMSIVLDSTMLCLINNKATLMSCTQSWQSAFESAVY